MIAQLANILTKHLRKDKFVKFRVLCGMRELFSIKGHGWVLESNGKFENVENKNLQEVEVIVEYNLA
jgi:hypothetical protein